MAAGEGGRPSGISAACATIDAAVIEFRAGKIKDLGGMLSKFGVESSLDNTATTRFFLDLLPPTTQGLWVAPQPRVGLWVAPTLLHATTRPKQLFIDATIIDTTNTHYTR